MRIMARAGLLGIALLAAGTAQGADEALIAAAKKAKEKAGTQIPASEEAQSWLAANNGLINRFPLGAIPSASAVNVASSSALWATL